MHERVGVIDLGSNTTRLIVMEYQRPDRFKLVDEVSEVARLAEGVGDKRVLQPEPMYRAIEALKMFHTFCRASGVNTIIATATSALREAQNRDEFLDVLSQQSDLRLRILSTEEEACYGYLGAINSLAFTNGFVFDTGGGSTQVTAVRNRESIRSFSCQAGIVRFTEQFVKSDPISKRDFRALEAAAVRAFSSLDWFVAGPGLELVGMGGTVRTLARMAQKKRRHPVERTHGYVLTRDALEEIVEQLRDSTQREREAIAGLNTTRADVILAGAVIVRQVMDRSNFAALTVSGQGLREGLFYEHFLAGKQPPLIDNVREFSVRNLALLDYYEPLHVAKVRALSLSLFDQLQALHGYGPWERELLDYAAMLHDIGVRVGYYDHHKHSAYLVFNSALMGFSHRELVLLALLARNHRKGEADVSEYSQVLAEDDRERLLKLSSLLRLAEYLERSKSQVVRDVHVELQSDRVLARVEADGDATVEVWDANRRSGLFKKAFGQPIEIVG